MKLTELFLNRFLYRDNSQNLETKDSAFISADSSEVVAAGVPSGGAAQDINTGNVQINGAILEPGTIPQTTLDVSNWGWGQTCVFSSVDNNTVAWGAGSFKSADGTTYAISAGNTGNMGAKTYIYLSLLDSTTAYQITTTPGTAVGIGKVLVAVANPDSVSATYNLSEATQIVGDNILANSINASKITTGQLIVGTNVGLGTAQDAAGVTTIVGNTITTGYVNALNITALGTVTTGTLTGILIQTSASANTGVKMNNSGLTIFGQSSFNFITTGGLQGGYIGANTSQTLAIYNQYGLVTIGTSSGGLEFGGNITTSTSIVPGSSGSYSCGGPSLLWSNVYTNNLSLSGGNYINYTGGFIQSNSQFRVVGSINLTGNLTFENNASITINGRSYFQTTGAYDPTKYYLRSA